MKKHKKKGEVGFGKNRRKKESFCTEPKIPEVETSLYNYLVNPACDDVIVKINEKICSSPFFYIVPKNPSPNFFFSPGSYYIIPEIPNSQEKNVIYHPERAISVGDKQDYGLSKHKKKPPAVSRMNNLGKEVPRKENSHLNIGPLDVKLNESHRNLETNCASHKPYEKDLFNNPLNSNGLHRIRVTKPNGELTNGSEEIDHNVDEGCSIKNTEGNQVLIDSNNLYGDNVESDIEEESEERKLYEITEIFESDGDSEEDYVGDFNSLEEELLWERLLSRLPEMDVGELREKFFEFQGDENLIENYIQETEKILKNRQLVLDMQFIFPDADPDFLEQEVEKLKNDHGALNVLIGELLDHKTYPKILENNPNNERRSLWQRYVENFSVKNFLLKVPNPRDFAGQKGDNNQTDMKLILKFLVSRYPSQLENFLEYSFTTKNRNLTNTCVSLAHLEPVRLAESSFKHEKFNEDFLKEICYIDHKEEIDSYLNEVEERKNLEIEEARLNDTFLSCPLCADVELVASEVTACPEGHIFCKECIKRYIFVKLGDGLYKYPCPSSKCDAYFSHTTLEELLPESVLLNIIKKQQAEEVSNAKLDGLEFCPFCEFGYIPNPEDKIFKCQNPECLSETCRKCKEKNHIPLRCEEIERTIDVEARKKIEESMSEQLMRFCPNCLKKFVKIDGCNKMQCTCGTLFCYICRKKIVGYDHFSRDFGSTKCPLYSNNETLHVANVVAAGVQARNNILQENPNVRIVYDPTKI